MKYWKIKQFGRICWFVLCMMLIGCSSKNNSESNTDVSNSIQEEQEKHNEIATDNSDIETEPTMEPEKEVVEKGKDEGISCRIEEDTLIFSGKGCLLQSVMEDCVNEYLELIGESASEKIVRVVIEEGITAIGANAFSGMWKLEVLEIAGSVERIGEYAFEGCESLKTVIMSNGVAEIAMGAFTECESLSEVEIPESVEIISSYAFAYTPWLEAKKSENQVVVVNGILMDATQASSDFEITEEITYTTAAAFENTGWIEKQREVAEFVIINGILIDGKNASGEVVVPEGVKCIADGAFSYCDQITSIVLPDSVERIGTLAFQGCDKLLKVNVPDSVQYIGAGAFSECINLAEAKIPEGIKGIEHSTFYSCTGLQKVKLSELIEYVGESAFSGCVALREIDLPKRIKVIGDYAFSNCSSVNKVTLPEAMNNIGEGIFDSCSGLVYVELPKNIVSIGDYAFNLCEKLENIQLPEKVENIGKYAFSKTSLKEIQIPDSVRSIADYSFWNCEYLEEIIIPESVASIGDCVFVGTPWLENPEKEMLIVNSILLYASPSESKIIIPNGVLTIAGGAFKNNPVVEVEIPNSVQNIGCSAFEGCNNLKSIILPENITMISEKTFCDCTSLEEIILPEKLCLIDQEAFCNCSSLTYIEIPDKTIDIRSEAFKGCSSLTRVNLPKGLTTIAYGLFNKCNSLTNIVIPEGVRTLESYSFYDCSSLISIAIPKSVEEIWKTFKNCYQMTIYCDSGSYTEQYALENDIRYLTVDEAFWRDAETYLPTERPSLKEIIENDADGLIRVSGEKCHAVMGEEKALVWKYVEATFDERAYFASAMVQDMSDIWSSEPSTYKDDAFRYTNWHKWYNWEEFLVKHVGDDMFLFEGYYYGEYFGYYINGSWHTTIEVNSWLEDEDDNFNRITEFSDGYAIGRYVDTYYRGSDYWLAILDKQGNMTVSDVSLSSYRTPDLGIYSDGVFYCDDVFYDINFNKVLDLSEKDWGGIYVKQGIYAPYFQNGVCRLITEKNGKHWIFDINESGEIISEIEEFEILTLSY